jgi:NAD(P)-dependent dehydrogenase (short-subunit alcohol dehydrogenase family)
MPTAPSDRRLLVTGGCGYVGSRLTQALLARGHAVTVLDTMWFGNFLPPHPRLTLLLHDMRKIDAVDLSGFDTIFHLANIANDPAVELNPYASWDVNVLATMRLADRAARQGVKQIVFASSGSVYGVTPEPRVTEEMDLNPISEYNKTKMVAERVILSYGMSLVATIIRPATVCGPSPRMRLDLTVNLLTMQALTNGAMTVLGGGQIRPNIPTDWPASTTPGSKTSQSSRSRSASHRAYRPRCRSSRRTIRDPTGSVRIDSWQPALHRPGTWPRPWTSSRRSMPPGSCETSRGRTMSAG